MENNNNLEEVTLEEAEASLKPDMQEVTLEEAEASLQPSDKLEEVTLDEAEKSLADDEISEMESLLHGFGEGASMGWSDEIVGRWKQLVEGGDYEQARNEYRDYLKKARAANPKSTIAGDVAGSIASGVTIGAVIPWANVGTAARLGHAAAVGAAEGAVSGLGRNEKEEDLGKDIATGAAWGAGGAGLFNAGGKAIGAIKNARKAKPEELFSEAGKKVIKDAEIPEDKIDEAFRLVNKHRDTYVKQAEKLDKASTSAIAKDHPEFVRWTNKKGEYTPKEMERINKLGNTPLDESELGALKKASQQGRLTPQHYLEFQEAKALHRVTKRHHGKFEGEAKENWFSSNLQAPNVKARQVDDILPEMRLERDLEKFTKNVNKANQEVRQQNQRLSGLLKMLDDQGVDQKTLIKNYEGGALDDALDTEDMLGFTQAIDNPFKPDTTGMKEVKRFMDNLYQDSADKGYRIDKLDNYIKKTFTDNDTILKNLDELLNTKRLSGQEAEEAVRNFKKITGYEGKIKNLEDLKMVVKEYKDKPDKLSRLGKSQEFKSAYERDPNFTIPDWAREYDLGKLIKKSIRESVENHYLRPVGEKILFKANKLKELGMPDKGEWFEQYAKDTMGINPPANAFKFTDYVKKIPVVNKMVNDDTVDYIGRLMSNSPYISHLGIKPVKAMKNLFQPINHTAPHMYGGSRRGYSAVTKQHFKTLSDPKDVWQWAKKYPQHSDEVKGYIKKGWIDGESSTDQINDALDVLNESGADIQPFIKKFGDGWEKTAKHMMVMFDMADKANRLTTIRASKNVANNIMGNTRLGRDALKALNSSARQEALLLKKAGKTDKLTDFLTSHYLDKTQFAYNKASRTQLGRNARGLNTFQTWPVQITSEILYDVGKGSADSAAQKYAVPYATAFAIGEGMHAVDPELYEEIFGKRGGAGFASWQPLDAFGGYGSLLGYQGDAVKGLYDTGKKAMEETMSNSEYQQKARDNFQGKVVNSGYIPALKNVSDFADYINDRRGSLYRDEEE